MKKYHFLLMLILGAFGLSAQHSGYAKLLYGRSTHEYKAAAFSQAMNDFSPGNGIIGELGLNLRVGQFEITPQVGYNFNAHGYSVYTDSVDESMWFSAHYAYLGAGAQYAIPVGKLEIHEVLIGGGFRANLPYQVKLKTNGTKEVLEDVGASLGAYADMKLRFRSNIGVWIEPSLRVVFQEFEAPNSSFGANSVNALSLQAGLAFVLPFDADTDK